MSNQKETVVLLGAGASQEAGVPTTFDMTQKLVERVSQAHSIRDSTVPALHFVCGALMAHDAATEGQSPYVGLDVERVFAAVELLAERNVLEVTPFIAAWHPAVDAWDAGEKSIPAFFNDKFQEAVLESSGIGGAGRLIADLIDSRVGLATDGKTYRQLAQLMLTQLRGLVATTEKQVSYLEPLVEAGKNTGLTIATLNYDLSVEQAARTADIACSTGVDNWIRTGRWEWPGKGIRLLKLHGSIDWMWAKTEERQAHLPQRIVTIAEDPSAARGQPAIVFGQRGKLRAEGPFLGLLGELESLMSCAQQLIVVGYSFRDEHVNELIQRWTSEDVRRTITVVDPHFPKRFPVGRPRDFRATMSRYLLPPDFKGEDFVPRLEIIRTTCSAALPALF